MRGRTGPSAASTPRPASSAGPWTLDLRRRRRRRGQTVEPDWRLPRTLKGLVVVGVTRTPRGHPAAASPTGTRARRSPRRRSSRRPSAPGAAILATWWTCTSDYAAPLRRRALSSNSNTRQLSSTSVAATEGDDRGAPPEAPRPARTRHSSEPRGRLPRRLDGRRRQSWGLPARAPRTRSGVALSSTSVAAGVHAARPRRRAPRRLAAQIEAAVPGASGSKAAPVLSSKSDARRSSRPRPWLRRRSRRLARRLEAGAGPATGDAGSKSRRRSYLRRLSEGGRARRPVRGSSNSSAP